jgi:signal transduction histidine kinase
LETAVNLLPDIQHVFIVGGTSAYDRSWEKLLRNRLAPWESKLDFQYLTDLAMPQLLERLKQLPEHSIVLLTSVNQDAAGTRFIAGTESGPMIIQASNSPIFSFSDVTLGHGEVGGHVFSFEAEGKLIGALSIRILQGERPQDIPVAKGTNAYLFDARALHRWGIKESKLPAGSVVLYRPVSPWLRYKWYLIGALIALCCALIAVVYFQRNRKQLKEARKGQLQLSGLLIDAQEKERRRLASELHDDFSQRLALLALGIETAADSISSAPREAEKQLHDLMNSTSEIGADLHTLSHQLHSSTLESLGLVAAITALCKEFASQQGVQVDFSAPDLPRSVSPESALCVFRIVQEGLRNAKKHSGVKHVTVNLRKIQNRLDVSIRDEGNGFDLTQARTKGGLGLRSMQERAQLLGGEFRIHSAPGRGTRIEARVPLNSQ